MPSARQAPPGGTKKRPVSLAAFLALSLMGCHSGGDAAKRTSTSQAPIVDPRFDNVAQMMRRMVDDGYVGTAIGLVAVAGDVVFLEAVGEAAPGVPMREDAIVRFASSGKTFAAAAALLLQEEGRLSLADPVARYLPEFSDLEVAVGTGPNRTLVEPIRPVTVSDLLTHTSGLDVASAGFEEAWNATEAKTTTRDLAARIARLPMSAQPGEVWNYGYYGSNYEVLAAVLEAASGMTLEALYRERIFAPLGMDDSHFFVPEDKQARIPATYQRRDGVLSMNRPAGEETERSTFLAGGGGVRSTLRDFHRYCQMLLGGGELEGVRILSAASVEAMMTDQIGPKLRLDEHYGWGLGGAVQVRPLDSGAGNVGTYGWNGGSGTFYFIDPAEAVVAIIVAPFAPPPPAEIYSAFEEEVYRSLRR